MANETEQLIDEMRSLNQFLTSSIDAQIDYYDKSSDVFDSISDYLKVLIDNINKDDNSSKENKSSSAAKGASGSKSNSTKDMFDFSKLGKSLPDLAKGLILFKKAEPAKFTAFVRNLTDAMTQDGKLKNPKQIKELYEGISKVFESLGDNLGKMGLGLMIFTLADKMGGPKSFVNFLDKFLTKERLAILGSDQTKQAAESLNTLGNGLLLFSIAAALSTPLLLIGLPGLLLFIPSMKLIQIGISMLGDDLKRIKEGGEAITYMAAGLILFSLSLILTRELEPTDFLMGIALIFVFAIFIGVIALMDKLVGGKKGSNEGADSIMYFGIALITVTIALLLTRLITFDDIIKGALIIGVLGGISILLGLAKDTVKDGAWAMLLVSASLIVAVIGVIMTKLVDWEDIGKAGAIIGGLSVAVIIVGMNGSMAMMGSIAMILISASLIVATIGIGMAAKFDWEDIGKAGAIIGGLGAAAVLIGLSGPLAILGSVAMLIMGASLIVMAIGIKKLLELEFTEDNTVSLLKLIGGLGIEFGLIGLGSLFIGLGAIALIGVGLALNSIGEGLLKFYNLNIPIDELSGENGTIYKVLTSVMEPFKKIGLENSVGGGFLNPFGSNPVAVGIASVEGIGDILVDIAKGVQEFANLTFVNSRGERIQLDSTQMAMVASNIQMVLGAVSIAFAQLGETNGETNWWSNGKIESGVKSVEGVGRNLVDIAKGVQEFANLKFTGKDGKQISIKPEWLGPTGFITTNIQNVISSISSALGLIGSSDGAQGDWWFGSSAISKGKSAIDGVGKNLLDIVKTAQGISDLTSKGFDPVKMETTIKTIIKGFSNALISIGSIPNSEKSAKTFNGISKNILDIANSSDGLNKSSLAIEKISNSLTKTFDGINKLGDDKLKNLKEFFQTLVEIEKFNAESFDKKMESWKELANTTTNLNVTGNENSGSSYTTSPTRSSKSSATNDNEKSSKELDAKVDLLNTKFDTMITLLGQISQSLKKPLSVDIIDNDINTLLAGR